MSEPIAMPHASTMESMGCCVFCGLPANDPGPCEKRPRPGESAATCHCGRTVEPRDPDPWEGRMDAYCEDCAVNRCDCYPDECPVKYPSVASVAQGRKYVACTCGTDPFGNHDPNCPAVLQATPQEGAGFGISEFGRRTSVNDDLTQGELDDLQGQADSGGRWITVERDSLQRLLAEIQQLRKTVAEFGYAEDTDGGLAGPVRVEER